MKFSVMEAAIPHRFTSAQYHEMDRYGIIPPDARVELLDGLIVKKVTINARHVSCVSRFQRLLFRRFDPRAHIQVQGALHLSSMSEPEPDIVLLKPSADDYAQALPSQEDVFALVEVADSSLSFDRGEKLRLYAQHRVADYWIVNLIDDCIEVHRDPHDLGYATRDVFGRDQTIALLSFPDDALAVNDILPPLKAKGSSATP